MSDPRERPDAPGAAESDDHPPTTTRPPARPAAGSDHWLLAALLVGAGAIHVAMSPSHLGESAVEGAGFLVAAWVQVALAVAVLLRPTRRVFAAVIATGLALIGAWALSRTAGLPVGAHAGEGESVTVVDGITVVLEGLSVALALVLRTPFATAVARAGRLAAAGAVGAVLLATGAVASPAARDHGSGGHDDHGTESADAAGAGAAGEHDHGTESANAVGSADAAEETADEAGAADEAGEHDHGTESAEADDDLGFSLLSNGHEHEGSTEETLTPRERVTLARQLAATADLVERYPTIADAEAAGWTRAGPFAPGLGVHYSPPRQGDVAGGSTDPIDPENMPTPMLVFDGLDPDAPLAGFMYLAYDTEGEPEGFGGHLDHWHHHESVCIVTREDGTIDTPFGADLDGVTEDMCTDVGGQWIDATGYMVHVWNVPGYESPDGMFTELNRAITCPDGTYYQIPIEDLGTRESTCRSA